ncbi:MAG: NUDIX hydrolase [Planctomycetota bacterium]|nr:NUDIX hydrolase [Planctomycetota bacterium]
MSYNYNYPRPMVTVDAVVFGLDKDRLQVLLVKRGKDPYRDRWALPGGFVDIDETLERAVERELEEETGLANMRLFYHRPYSIPDRDPGGREHLSSLSLASTLRTEKDVAAGDDAAEVKWFDALEPPPLAFDHSEILSDAILRLRDSLSPLISSLPHCRCRSRRICSSRPSK